MGCAILHRRTRNLVIFWLFLVISSYTSAIGRPVPELIEVEESPAEMMNEVRNRRSVIGSNPPRCEKKCSSCGGPCEAVQVPIAPSKLIRSHNHLQATLAYSRGDDISNYKPMCWKCKCGNFMFNP